MRARRKKLVSTVSVALLAGLATSLSCIASANANTIDLGTAGNASNWLITGAGATNAPAFQVDDHVSLTSTGAEGGTFISGGSLSSFDGFWTATETFFLPATAINPVLSFANLIVDDRLVLELNGVIIGDQGFYAPGLGEMSFIDGGPDVPYTFKPISNGTVFAGFNFGGINTLSFIVNNTNSGIYGATKTFAVPGDGTGAGGQISLAYATPVPEPASLAIFATGLLGLGLIRRRKRN